MRLERWIIGVSLTAGCRAVLGVGDLPDARTDGAADTGADVDAPDADGATATDGEILLGSYNQVTNDSQLASGNAIAYQVVATSSGMPAVLHLLLTSQSTCSHTIFGVYDDDTDHPHQLVVRGDLTSAIVGWNETFALTKTTAVTSGVSYWIALLCPVSATGTLHYVDNGTVQGIRPSEHDIDTSLDDLPTIWATGLANALDGPVEAYVTK